MTSIREKAMYIGKLPYGAAAYPSVFLCGQCRAVEIDSEQGICRTCEGVIANIETGFERKQSNAIKVMLCAVAIPIIGYAACLVAAFISASLRP